MRSPGKLPLVELAPPYGEGNYTAENFPGALQIQAIGMNNSGGTVGFYVDGTSNNFGFVKSGDTFTTVSNPSTGGTTMVNQLLGVNNNSQAAGFYNKAGGTA